MRKLNQMYNIPSDITIRLIHLHAGNSSRTIRKNKPYITLTEFLDQNGRVIAKGKAECSRKDNPSRKRGRDIAISRARNAYALYLSSQLAHNLSHLHKVLEPSHARNDQKATQGTQLST